MTHDDSDRIWLSRMRIVWGRLVANGGFYIEGPQKISPFDFRRHYRQTRLGHARGERGRPQFTAHNSVRSLKSGLSLGGSSATRP